MNSDGKHVNLSQLAKRWGLSVSGVYRYHLRHLPVAKRRGRAYLVAFPDVLVYERRLLAVLRARVSKIENLPTFVVPKRRGRPPTVRPPVQSRPRGRPQRPISLTAVLIALQETGGSVRRAAEILCLPKTTLSRFVAREVFPVRP